MTSRKNSGARLSAPVGRKSSPAGLLSVGSQALCSASIYEPSEG